MKVFTLLGSLVAGWVDVKKSKMEAEKAFNMRQIDGEINWDIEAMRQAQYSWKDEFITFVWFAPLIVAWFEPSLARDWLDFVSEMPVWYQIGMFGIIAASFGLRWFFKQQGLKLGKGE